MNQMAPCIYKITSPSGKAYIGQTLVALDKRMKDHLKSSSNCKLLKRAIIKYGWESMKVEVLLYCQERDLNTYEQAMIKAYDTLAPSGYNCTTGGEAGKRLCEETKMRIHVTSVKNECWKTLITPEACEKRNATNRLPENRKRKVSSMQSVWAERKRTGRTINFATIKPIQVKKGDDVTWTTFETQRAAMKALSVSNKTIDRGIRTGRLVRGYYFQKGRYPVRDSNSRPSD